MAWPETAAQRRTYIRTSIKMQTWRTESGASILRSLQSAGIGIQEKAFFALRREILDLSRFEEQIRRLRPETRTPKAWFDPAPGWKLKRQFLYQVEIKGTDPFTGKATTQFHAVSSNTEMTPEAIENKVANDLAGEEEFYKVIPDSITFFHPYHAVGKPP